MGGQNADGENRLNQIVNDTSLPAIIRGEAAYHLATLAASAGRADDAVKLYNQVQTLAPKSSWSDNATFQLDRMSVTGNAALPITVSPAASGTGAATQPAVSFPAGN
jgi:hypothetical protein